MGVLEHVYSRGSPARASLLRFQSIPRYPKHSQAIPSAVLDLLTHFFGHGSSKGISIPDKKRGLYGKIGLDMSRRTLDKEGPGWTGKICQNLVIFDQAKTAKDISKTQPNTPKRKEAKRCKTRLNDELTIKWEHLQRSCP